MIDYLKIKNFCLLKDIEISFNKGVNIITGQTGAGKTMIFKALTFLTQEKCHQDIFQDNKSKIIVECNIKCDDLLKFKNHLFNLSVDINDNNLIFRKELLTNFRSRLFINDELCSHTQFKNAFEYFVNIFSQNDNQFIKSSNFVLNLIDSFAFKNDNKLNPIFFKSNFKKYRKKTNLYKELGDTLINLNKEIEFNNYQLDQLNSLDLKNICQNDLEEKYQNIENKEKISEVLNSIKHNLDTDHKSLLSNLKLVLNHIELIIKYSKKFTNIKERLLSIDIEINDILIEINDILYNFDINEEEIQITKEKFDKLNSLLYKHNVKTIEQLIKIKQKLLKQNQDTDKLNNKIKTLKNEIIEDEKNLLSDAKIISKKRLSIINELSQKIIKILQNLGMTNVDVCFENKKQNLCHNGIDKFNILFSANLGTSQKSIKKVASGGEISRFAFAVNSIISEFNQNSCQIYDEIDTGISGDVCLKMASLIKKHSKHNQVILITHHPQIAAIADCHYYVYKTIIDNKTITNIQKVEEGDRCKYLAMMIDGTKFNDSSLKVADELIHMFKK